MGKVFYDEASKNVCIGTVGDPLCQRVGQALCDVDGFYKFFPELHRPGYWDTWLLRDIAALIDSMNAEWAALIAEEIGGSTDGT